MYITESDKKSMYERMMDFIKKAEKATHNFLKINQKLQAAQTALESDSKKFVWQVLQDYLMEYGNFINSLTFITNVKVYQISQEQYERLSADEIKNSIRTVMNFIYLKEIFCGAGGTQIEQYIRKNIRNEGNFTEEELAVLGL